MTESSNDLSPRLGGQNPLPGDEPALTGDRALLHALEMLNAPDEETRLEAVIALDELGDERAAEHLLRLLDGALSYELANRAAGALGTVGRAALPHLLSRLVDPAQNSLWLPRSISQITYHFPELREQITPVLIQMLQGENDTTQLRALRCMGSVHDARCIPVLLDTLAGSTDPRFRNSAIQALGQMGSLARRPEVVDALFDMLARMPRPGPGDMATVAHVLGQIGDPNTIPRALALTAEPGSMLGPHLHLMAPGKPPRQVVPDLIEAYADPRQERNREYIARMLAGTDDERAVDTLINALGTPGAYTGIILDALRRMRPRRAVPALVALLKEPHLPSTIEGCLEALLEINDPSVAPDVVPVWPIHARAGGSQSRCWHSSATSRQSRRWPRRWPSRRCARSPSGRC